MMLFFTYVEGTDFKTILSIFNIYLKTRKCTKVTFCRKTVLDRKLIQLDNTIKRKISTQLNGVEMTDVVQKQLEN